MLHSREVDFALLMVRFWCVVFGVRGLGFVLRILSLGLGLRGLRVGVCSSGFTWKMCSGSEAGSYLRLIDFCITQL